MKTLGNKKLFYWIFVAFVLVLIGWVCFEVGKPMVRFASQPERFRLWVDSNGVWGRLAYMGMMMIQILVAFLPGEPFEFVAGYAFGALEGTVLCFVASALGSCIVLCLVRKFGMRLVKLFFSDEKINSVKFLRSSKKRIILFSIIFILPGTPKDLLCYFAGITDIKLWVLMLICSLGRLPAIITSTIGGDAIGTESYILAIIVYAVTAIISVGGILIYNFLRKKHEKKTEKYN